MIRFLFLTVALGAAVLQPANAQTPRHGDDDDEDECVEGKHKDGTDDDDCGPDRGPPKLPNGKNLTYRDVARTIEKRCAKCHAPGERAEFLPLHTKEDIKLSRDFMFDALNSGFMPLNKPGFRYKDEALQLQAWLKEGRDWDQP